MGSTSGKCSALVSDRSDSIPHFTHSQSLQLRQAKLSFPQTHLIVGVFSDAERGQHNLLPLRPHVERCEVVRHCRWVDEVVPDAPWALDEERLKRYKIDYVAVEEGSTGMSDPLRVSIRPTERCDA
jgi:choline-phosphate cytidylyltransferase